MESFENKLIDKYFNSTGKKYPSILDHYTSIDGFIISCSQLSSNLLGRNPETPVWFICRRKGTI